MKTAVFYGGPDIRVEEIALPRPGDGEVLVQVAAAGICGSDLHYYRGEDPWGSAVWPQRLGHELAGLVVEVGRGVTRCAVGQRVAVEPMHLKGCGDCRSCLRGAYHLCPRRGIYRGARRASCGFSEFDLIAESNVFALPDSVPFDVGALTDVYACAVHALHRAPLRPQDTVVVFGTGPVGLAIGQLARLQGCRRTLLVGRRDAALETALALGAADVGINSQHQDVLAAVHAASDGWGADVVFESVGGAGLALPLAVSVAARGAVVVLVGAFHHDVAVAYREANRRELDLRWSSSYSTWAGMREFQIALDLIAERGISAAPMLTHRFPLSRIGEAFATANDRAAYRSVKVLVEPVPTLA